MKIKRILRDILRIHKHIAHKVLKSIRIKVILCVDSMRMTTIGVFPILINNISVEDLPRTNIPRIHTIFVVLMMDNVVNQVNAWGNDLNPDPTILPMLFGSVTSTPHNQVFVPLISMVP